jgi:hypothetical protein
MSLPAPAVDPVHAAILPQGPAVRLKRRLATRYPGRIAGELTRPAAAARWAALPPELNPSLKAALQAREIRRLYSHQRQAYDLALAGRHLVVATPTASGKTLCYNLPVLDALPQGGDQGAVPVPHQGTGPGPGGGALRAQPGGHAGASAYTFDGDTPGDARKAVRTRGDIVVSNPDMLHQAILPHHTKWAQFFEGLRFVVVDELHSYRGVFGSHVANVLRRLQARLPLLRGEPSLPLRLGDHRQPGGAGRPVVRRGGDGADRERSPPGGATPAAVEPAGDRPGSGHPRLGPLPDHPHRPPLRQARAQGHRASPALGSWWR